MRYLGGIFFVMIFLLGGCACPPTDPDELIAYQEANDPLEPMNRTIFEFNMTADRYVLEPIARGYRYVTPQPIRTGIRNFFANLRQPMYLANALFQGELETAGTITKRFAANTFWGFLGVFDTASELGIPSADNDFGQTLAVWGWQNSEPYLILPFLGPSNPRDTIGIGVDAFLAPIDWVLKNEPFLLYSRIALENFSKREQALDFLDSLEGSSTDFYATIRSMYRQNRKKKIDDSIGIIAEKRNEQMKQDYDFDFPLGDEEY